MCWVIALYCLVKFISALVIPVSSLAHDIENSEEYQNIIKNTDSVEELYYSDDTSNDEEDDSENSKNPLYNYKEVFGVSKLDVVLSIISTLVLIIILLPVMEVLDAFGGDSNSKDKCEELDDLELDEIFSMKLIDSLKKDKRKVVLCYFSSFITMSVAPILIPIVFKAM